MQDQKLEKCIEEIKKGHVDAFAYVVEKYQTLAINVAQSIVKNPEDAEEVAQDAFVKIFRFINQYNGESRFSSWLYKVVFNTALTKANMTSKQLMRKEEIKSSFFSFENNSLEQLELEKADTSQIIQEGLDQMSTDDRVVLTLFYLAEKSVSEIAEITGWRPSNCKVKLMRARKRLKEILKNRKTDLI